MPGKTHEDLVYRPRIEMWLVGKHPGRARSAHRTRPFARKAIPVPALARQVLSMKFFWSHTWRRINYARGTHSQRRELELRMVLARHVRELRKKHRFTQKQVADWMGSAPSTISHLERGKVGVSFDFGIRVLLILNASDSEIAAAFNMTTDPAVRSIRARKSCPLTPPFDGMVSRHAGDQKSAVLNPYVRARKKKEARNQRSRAS